MDRRPVIPRNPSCNACDTTIKALFSMCNKIMNIFNEINKKTCELQNKFCALIDCFNKLSEKLPDLHENQSHNVPLYENSTEDEDTCNMREVVEKSLKNPEILSFLTNQDNNILFNDNTKLPLLIDLINDFMIEKNDVVNKGFSSITEEKGAEISIENQNEIAPSVPINDSGHHFPNIISHSEIALLPSQNVVDRIIYVLNEPEISDPVLLFLQTPVIVTPLLIKLLTYRKNVLKLIVQDRKAVINKLQDVIPNDSILKDFLLDELDKEENS